MTDARREDYWEGLEEADADELTLERVAVAKCGDEWSPHAVVYAGEDDEGTEYLLVVRSRIGDSGSLILSERYVAVPADLEEVDDARWLGNGIERRVNGRLTTALVRAYARADNDTLADPQGPPALLDGTVDGETDPTESDALERPLLEPEPEAEPEPAEKTGDGRRRSARETVDPHAGARREAYQCVECGKYGTPDDLVNLGSALGEDQWVHERACEEYDDVSDDGGDVETDGGSIASDDDMISCAHCGARWHVEADVPIEPCPACEEEGGVDGA